MAPAGPWPDDEDGELASLPVYWGEAAPPDGSGDEGDGDRTTLLDAIGALAALFEPDPDAPADGGKSLLDVTPDRGGLDDGKRRHDVTTFLCMLPLPGPALGDAVGAWWSAEARGDELVVRHRLRVRAPEFRTDLGGWRLPARLRRRGRWIPMVLELTPHMSYGTMLHLRPERTVHPSGMYFRSGHRVVREICDRLLRSAP